MKMKYCKMTMVVGLFMLLMGAAATVQAIQDDGDRTLQLAGGYFHGDGSDTGILNLDLSYGYYITVHWELGILQSLAYSFNDRIDDVWAASTIPYFNYHFRTQETFQPFIGAFIGGSYNENDLTGTIGPQAGFKSYVSDKTYVMARYRYEWFFEELEIGEIGEDRSDGNHVVTLGVGFNF